MTRRTPRTLYHYCSLQTFFNIVKSKSIWLSDISKSNDSLELKWIKEKCSHFIMKAWKNYVSAASSIDGHEIIDHGKYFALQERLKDFITFETERCWAFCLSEKKDDLGQWRGYAEDGKGISIGFKSSFFTKKMNSEKATKDISDPYKVIFDSIIYDDKEVEKQFCNDYGLSSITPSMSSEEVIKIMKKVVVVSLLLASLYKSKTFVEEKEWRLVFSVVLSELMAGKTPVKEFADLYPNNTIQYDYVVRDSDLVSHIAFGDENMHKNISEIWIGPKCKLSYSELKLFLIANGFLKNYKDESIKIYESPASYR